jgi:hypothetical protein
MEEYFERDIEKVRKDIGSMDISEEERNKLYSLYEETIQREKERRASDLTGAGERLEEALTKMYKNITKIYLIAENASAIMHITNINLQLANEKMKENGRVIKGIQRKQGLLERRLNVTHEKTEEEKRFEIIDVTGQILRGMKNQKN